MEIDILNKKENKALDRTEVKFDCIYSGEATPKVLDVKSKLVALLDTKKDLIVVDSIQPHFGEAKAAGYAKIYGSKESLEDIETEHAIAKNKEAEVEAPAEEEGTESVEEATESEDKSEDSEEAEAESEE
jgi:small subunit ribosomal protein S24e